jgi:hypothetical protein
VICNPRKTNPNLIADIFNWLASGHFEIALTGYLLKCCVIECLSSIHQQLRIWHLLLLRESMAFLQLAEALVPGRLRGVTLVPFFANRPASRVVKEACGSAHHWARVLARLGHDVRLIADQFVRPFVKSNKNDAADAAAIWEAARGPCASARSMGARGRFNECWRLSAGYSARQTEAVSLRCNIARVWLGQECRACFRGWVDARGDDP